LPLREQALEQVRGQVQVPVQVQVQALEQVRGPVQVPALEEE
jgi:hypothetical protein